ncbi:MAG: DUF5661 family protein, partial [Candidatus Omnitrophota bacterium]
DACIKRDIFQFFHYDARKHITHPGIKQTIMTTTVARKQFTTEEARQIARKIGHTWSNAQELENLRMGMNVELEHGLAAGANNVTSDDPVQTAKIALAHLAEFGDYYQRLDEMERAALHPSSGPSRAIIIAIIAIVIGIIIVVIVMMYRATNESMATRARVKKHIGYTTRTRPVRYERK